MSAPTPNPKLNDEIEQIVYSLHPRHRSGDCQRIIAAIHNLESLLHTARQEGAKDFWKLYAPMIPKIFAGEITQKDVDAKAQEIAQTFNFPDPTLNNHKEEE